MHMNNIVRHDMSLFFSAGLSYSLLAAAAPGLSWQCQHEVNSSESLCVGFLHLKGMIGFLPEPCRVAGSLALRLGVYACTRE
jgi:hypothetical protein